MKLLYEVVRYHAGSLSNLLSRGSLKGLVSRYKPDVIFLHLGLQDLANSTSVDEVVNLFRRVIWNIVEAADRHRICVSLIPPCDQYKNLNRKISDVNKAVSDMVTDIRRSCKDGYTRLCSIHNSLLEGRMRFFSGEGFRLTEHGQNLMWVQLRYGITKALKLTDTSTTLYHSNLSSHG